MAMKPTKALVSVVVGLLGAGLTAPIAAAAEPAAPAGIGRVAAVFPLTTPELRTALIDADTLVAYTAPTGPLTRDLNAVIDTPVAIGIDPMILASIRVLGRDAPPSAVAWLDRLNNATNETFPLAYADADITLGTQAGSPQVLGPTSFDFAINPSRFAPAETDPATEPTGAPTATPTPPADPNAMPALPTMESLLAWDYTLQSVAWPVAGTVVNSDLTALREAEYSSVILSSGNVDRGGVAQARANVGGTAALITDDGLSERFDATVAGSISTEDWASSVASLQGLVAATAATGGPEGVTILLAVNRESLGGATRLGPTVAALDGLANADVVGLSAIAGSPAIAASLVDRPHTPARVAAAQSLLAAEVADSAFATVAENPLLITGERRLRLLVSMSTAWISYPGGRGAAAKVYLDESARLHQSVGVVKSSDINFVADRSSLPVTVSNSLNQPVTVYITVSALSPILAVEQVGVPVTIEPDSQRRSLIPVQSLSNGTAQIMVTLASGAAVPIGEPTSVRINVYAGWETPVTVAISFLVFGVFAFGVARVIVRRRKARREARGE